jgi:hypothetical protein
VELNDLKGATNYAMACIAVPAEGEEQQSLDVVEGDELGGGDRCVGEG